MDWQHQYKEERDNSLKIKTDHEEVTDYGAGNHTQHHNFFNAFSDHPALIEEEEIVLPADCVKNVDKLLVSFDH